MALWSSDRKTQISGFPGGATKQNPYGQAQPVQPQSQGTPYGSPTKPPPAGMVYNKAPSSQPANFSAYAPQQQANFSAYQPAQQASSNPFAQYNPQQIGNFVQQQMGLPSFQFNATDSFGNTYDNPAALAAQQGAMAQALNAQRAQQIQSGNFGQLNPMAAYQQAQNMVQGGWTNPFAAQPAQPPSQGTPYGQSLQASPARPGYTHTPDGRLLYSGPPEVGLQAPPRQAPPQPSPDAYYPGDVFFPPAGQAQPIQPPSPGTPYGQQSVPAPQANGPPSPPPQSQAAPPRSYADERRAQDQAAYEEIMQQIRMSGGATQRIAGRKRELERRLGLTAAAPDGRGQESSPSVHVKQHLLGAPPSFAQPIQPPSQGTQYGQPPAQMPVRPLPGPPRPGQPATMAVGEYGQPPSQMPPAQQGPTLASFLESESGLTIDDVMAKGGMMWSTLNHYLGGKLNAKQKTQLQKIQNAWRAKEQMKGGLGGATGIWEMPPEAKYGPPEKRKKAQAEWEQKKAWQKQRDDAEIKQQLSDLLNSVSGGGPAPPHLQTGPAPFQPQFGYTGR